MASNIDACIFLPGHIANGDEEINIPLLGMEQIERLMDLYRDRHYAPFFPYIAEAITLIRSKHQCERTPLVNRWIEILTIGEHKYIDHILCILLLKYGWDIPQNIFKRCVQYAKFIMSECGDGHTSYYRADRFIAQRTVDEAGFEMSRILYQLGQPHCMDHLVYIAEYCIGVIRSIPRLDVGNLMVMVSNTDDIPSKLKLYHECVKTLVNMCVMCSYVGITTDVPDSILESNIFRTCLLQQPLDLLTYFCGDMSIAKRFELGIGRRIPEYADKKTLAVLMEKTATNRAHNTDLSLIGIPEMHTQSKLGIYGKSVLGMNPSVRDYTDIAKGIWIAPQAWYCGGLSIGDSLTPTNKHLIYKSLVGIWRMHAGNYTHTPIGYIAEVAKRLDANTDDILGASFTIRMSNIAWAIKDMPELYDMGMKIGPLTVNMINIYAIKHAKQSQSITGLQKMVEVINNGDK